MNNLKYNGTVTGRMESIPSIQNLPKATFKDVPFIRTAEDDDLLNSLAQPLPAAKAARRRSALARCISYAARGMERRLNGEGDPLTAEAYLSMAEKYQALYKFTEEELNGYSS